MTSDDVLTWPATQLAEAIRQRQVSSRELLEVALDRVDRINPKLNAVVTLDVERAPLLINWTGLIGVMGLPSAVPPVGTTATSGMPVGVQVVAPWYHDREAIRAAGLPAEACGAGYRVPAT
ncbi:MAG: hypothetical protein ACRDZN_15010 [Acidimicrobiales bacterium]